MPIRLAMLALVLVACAHLPAPADPDTLYVVTDSAAPIPIVMRDWRQHVSAPLREKIFPAPEPVLSFIAKDNVSMGFTNVPRAVPLDETWKQDFSAALSTLPERVQAVTGERLLGIYPVADLGGSAYTEAVSDAQGNIVGAFVALDVEVLDRTANAWATWKENSPFVASPDVSLEAVIEEQANDTRANALQYILLHELGHVFSVTSGALPKWNTQPALKLATFPYSALSWSAAGEKLVASSEAAFPERTQVHYYASGKRAQPMALALKVYERLAQTPFPTLYASTNLDDDFADSFANFVHVQLLHRPWRIVLHARGEPARVVESCWSEPRCAGKRSFFEARLLQP